MPDGFGLVSFARDVVWVEYISYTFGLPTVCLALKNEEEIILTHSKNVQGPADNYQSTVNEQK